MACEGFVFALATFQVAHFIWGEPFYSPRGDYFDYSYLVGFPIIRAALYRGIFTGSSFIDYRLKSEITDSL